MTQQVKHGPPAEEVPFTIMVHRAIHSAGQCTPCIFFTRKEDGCRKGDASWRGRGADGAGASADWRIGPKRMAWIAVYGYVWMVLVIATVQVSSFVHTPFTPQKKRAQACRHCHICSDAEVRKATNRMKLERRRAGSRMMGLGRCSAGWNV